MNGRDLNISSDQVKKSAIRKMTRSWTRQRIVIEFSGFPKCIAQIVAEYCMIPKLLSWINECLLIKKYLCGNPRAIESGEIDPKYAEPEYLASNPAAADYIKNNWNKFSSKNGIWENPELFDWIREFHPNHVVDLSLVRLNPNPNAIKYMLENVENGIGSICLSNPSITKCSHWSYISSDASTRRYSSLYGNPLAYELICDDLKPGGIYLSKNPHPKVIDYLRTHQDMIYWIWFSANPGIFEYRIDPELINELSE